MKFKHEKDLKRFTKMHPVAIRILGEMCEYCYFKDMPFVVTSTVTTKQEDDALGRKSSTHRTGRAFDLSIEGWTERQTSLFVGYFSTKFIDVAAISNNGKPVLIPDINHGSAPHIHVQINRLYSIDEPLA